MAGERTGKERSGKVEGFEVSRSWRARREVVVADVELGRGSGMGELEAWRR